MRVKRRATEQASSSDDLGLACLSTAGFTASELKDHYTLEELKAGLFTAAECRQATYYASELRRVGFFAADLKAAGYSPADMRNAGYSAVEMREAMFAPKKLRIAGYTALVSCLTIPGLLLSAYLVADDRLGPKWLQVLGFALIAIVLGVLGFVYEPLQSHDGVLMLVFCIASLVINFGPGTTTYVLPQRVFPVEVRSTANGIAAAAGKIGSFIATAGFKPLVAAKGLPAVFFVCCGISALGMAITYLLVPEAAVADREGLELRPNLSRPSLATSSLFTRDTSVREDFPDLHTLRNAGHVRSASHEQALAQVKGVVARTDPVSGLL